MSGWLAGVDGCPAGWAVVWRRLDGDEAAAFSVAADFASILDDPRQAAIVAVDMPIGLPDRVGKGGRGPEAAVRPLLGERQSSVFSVPSRAAVMTPDYTTACRVALATSEPPRKVSKQCFHLFPRIREIDALMTAALEARVFECHPELAFWRLNGERPMTLPKKVKSRASPAGIAERTALLARHGYDAAWLAQDLPRGVGRDDLIDAAALALVAGRIARAVAQPFPPSPGRDGKGLRIAIWA
jgi:predicted RNase H-like nuclease